MSLFDDITEVIEAVFGRNGLAYGKTPYQAKNKNANEWRTRCRTRMTMNCVREFKGKDYYIPRSFDYRGRAYTIPAFLTPQDTDFGKAILRFADEAIVTDVA